ncbi:ribonuclease HI family protein [Leptospira sp. GIMC2001]|uniref:ribonuclease HI family protein n=1 Tax=Leptospira sp. GIMC2001 TaxID=1513297 RepID=UPI00234AD369|nr:ribonuclease HI family protein [Leptospira sp. GIMC2001]WCL51294.1 ribonuclease HI family protein [Leptospira sp. GIMC2001]
MVKIYCDGASKGNPGPASIGVWATDESGDGLGGEKIFELSETFGKTTNNQAEWQALVRSLEEANRLGIQAIQVHMDSELVVRQVTRIYKVKKPELKPYFDQATKLIANFKSFSIKHIPRELNKKADALANLALS